MNTQLVSAVQPGNIWRYVGKLLRLRWILFASGFKRSKTRRKIGLIIVWIIVLGFMVTAFVLSWLLLNFLRRPQVALYVGDLTTFLESVPVMVLATSFLGIVLTSFGVLLQALYLAGDMDFLLSAPVPVRSVFISKMLLAILPNYSLITLFGLPLLFGLGISGGYNILYFPLVIIEMALLALAAAGISSLLVMGVVRIFPAKRVGEVLAFLGATISIICSQAGNVANMTNAYDNVDPQQVARSLEIFNRFNNPWLPLSWPGRGLVDIGEGRWLTGLLFTALTLAISAGVFYFSLATAERLYYTGWASMQVSPKRKKPARAAKTEPTPFRGLRTFTERLIPAQLRGIIVKDLLVVRRDLRNMSQVITPMIFGVIYGFILLRQGGDPPAGQGEAPEAFMNVLRTAMLYGNIGISLFVGWSLLSRLAMVGFSQEGKSYWMIKTAPISTGRLLLSKFLVAYLPALILGWIFLIGISLLQRASLGVVLFGLPVIALCLAGVAGINLAFGVRGAKLDWSDPRQMTGGSSGCLGGLLSMIFLAVDLGLFFGPALLLPLLSAAGLPEIPEWIGQLVGLLLGGALAIAATLLPPWLVRQRVPLIGEGV